MRLKLVCKRPPYPASTPGHVSYPSAAIDVIDADTGERIEGVLRVEYTANHEGLTHMVVEVIGAEAEVECEGVVVPETTTNFDR